MYGLSKKQDQVYALLEDSWLINNRQPNLSELAKQLDMHYVTLRQHLDALETKGYLNIETQGRGKSPIIKLLNYEYMEAA